MLYWVNISEAYFSSSEEETQTIRLQFTAEDLSTIDEQHVLKLNQAKRKKAQEVQSHNKCPQRSSRGGYELLEKKMMEEKIKERQEASQDPSELIPPPSPPTRHERWKRARINTSGQYITPEVGLIAKKITAFNAYQLMKGTHSRQLKKLKWVYPKCCKRGGGDECGLFVMRHMFEIIKLDIVDSFEKVFNMEEPYSDDDIDVVPRNWAECFMELQSHDRFDELPSPDKTVV
ncbi:hypothetical protein CASFOL_028532 [Castilleja foliolosa]|uniref:Ubiquitin-like protease family profile domain-containing protein n=1 Tax=Castilleja foliolosa TaxID=1961234 RepID=A0ABD3CCV3_9LAMI